MATVGAADEPTTQVIVVVDSQLLMAARCGDSNELKRLLQQPQEEEEEEEEVACGLRRRSLRRLYGETATGGDSLLHVVAAASGDGDGFVECAKTICGKTGGRCLLLACNKNGDTPLHCAAAAGNASMISCLLDLAGDEQQRAALVRAQNRCGETALHHAVRRACCCSMMQHRSTSVDCIDKLLLLMAVDDPLPDDDDDDASSPLYLAISLGDMEIARHLFSKSKGKLSYSGPDGRNVLHAAVSCANNAQALGMILEWLKGDDLLMKRLTSQGDKKKGSTPLHLAASLWGFPTTTYISKWSWMSEERQLVVINELLAANPSTAYQADKQGMYPIHVSAGAGSSLVIERILKKCPECAGLRDAKGRTFLHVAVDKGKLAVVNYVCRTSDMSWMLNALDDNGDTALHRAVQAGNLGVCDTLFQDPRVRLDVANKEGMRPVDVAWTRMPLEAYYAWDRRIHIRNLLLKVSAPYGATSRGDLFKEEHAAKTQRQYLLSKGRGEDDDTTSAATQLQLFEGGDDTISNTLTSAAQVMGILSVLVTTVTFASAFTLPGGYGADGTPVLAGSYAFDAFVLADAMAFLFSLVATSSLLYAGVPAFTLAARFSSVNRAYALMMHSARSLVAAFGLGLYVTLHPVARAIAIVIAVLMGMLALAFFKESERIDICLFCRPIVATTRKPSPLRFVLDWIGWVLGYLWSYLLIFGIPIIRKWARGRP